MALANPPIDIRRFQDIVDEAKKKIPAYFDGWTDHNVSDPGVTFIELFAWMTEMILYQTNQMPDRHYLNIMKLLVGCAADAYELHRIAEQWLHHGARSRLHHQAMGTHPGNVDNAERIASVAFADMQTAYRTLPPRNGFGAGAEHLFELTPVVGDHPFAACWDAWHEDVHRRQLPLPARHEGQPLEQMHVLLVFQQRAVQFGQCILRVAA